MSDWTSFANGTWGDAAKWTGGVPDAVGATANFLATNAGAASAIVSFAQDTDFTVGTLNIVTDSNDSYTFRGQVDATLATLRFSGTGGSPAFLNVDTNGSSSEISNGFGLRIVLESDLIISTANADTLFKISAPISGFGRDIYKFGDGTLQLTADNSLWTGDLLLRGGRTEIVNNAAEGGGIVELDNGAALVGTADFNFSGAIETRTGNAIGVIAAATGTEMQLLGKVSLRSNVAGAITFGSATDQGTITIGTTSGSIVTGAGGFRIVGGTVDFGGSNGAVVNFFNSLSSTGFLEISTGGTLDTRGLGINITNLDLDGGTIRTSLRSISLVITDTTSGGNTQAGTIIGTANFDEIFVNVTTAFTFANTTFSGWTSGTDFITLNGNNGNNDITGSSQNDTINGGGGNDVLNGGLGADLLTGGTGDDTYQLSDALDTLVENSGEGTDTVEIQSGPTSFTLAANFENLTFSNNANNTGIGNGAVNTIIGGGGNDMLDGKGGADTLQGRTGDDFYFVDNGNDTVIELAGQGNDRVFAGVSYALAAGVSVELLTTDFNAGTAAINLTGNELVNTIFGNDGVNMLDGKGGADTLIGRLGDDMYFVDNAGDGVVELTGEGNDRVFAGVSYALAAGASVELLTTDFNAGTGAINLSGNELVNTIFGNDGVNMLDGKGGADTLVGRLGDDMYFVDNAADAVIENANEGNDRVFASTSWTLAGGASVELITTADNAGTTAINLTGNELANTIFGNDGANVLDGKGGADSLVGRAGGDTFAFTTTLGAGNVDRIIDFQGGLDKVALDDAVFTGIGALGPLAAGAFVNGAAAADASDRIIYNQTTGELFFDADGTGGIAAVLFATLDTKPALTAGDFTVI